MRFQTRAIIVAPILLALCACDPQKDALDLFRKQGLTVLQPARDYIALGGLFAVPKSGTPAYLDPFDSLSSTEGTATPFKAIVLSQTSNRSAAFSAAVGTLGALIPIPAGLQFSASKQVKLSQIDSSGTRYTSPMIAALVRKPSTTTAIQGQLQDGNRVFIVQELYLSKSLSVSSSSDDGLAASVYGSASIPKCSSASSGDDAGTTKSTSSSKATATGAKTSDTGTKTDTSASGGSGTPTSKANANNKGKASAVSSSGSGTGTKAPSATSSSIGISVGVCWAKASTLSFVSETAIPFAVRLNEVVKGPGGVLQVKITNFKLPGTSLGTEDTLATAQIDPANPVLTGLVHRSH